MVTGDKNTFTYIEELAELTLCSGTLERWRDPLALACICQLPHIEKCVEDAVGFQMSGQAQRGVQKLSRAFPFSLARRTTHLRVIHEVQKPADTLKLDGDLPLPVIHNHFHDEPESDD